MIQLYAGQLIDLRSTKVTVNGEKLKSKHFNVSWAVEERPDGLHTITKAVFFFIPLTRKAAKFFPALWKEQKDWTISVGPEDFSPTDMSFSHCGQLKSWPQGISVSVESIKDES